MVSQHGILLAVGLISDHFGPLVSKVCGCLLRHGALPLQEIVHRVELSPGQVKNSLLVLIQHNCVQAFSSPRGGGDKSVINYLAILGNVLHRLHFSKFLSVIHEDIRERIVSGTGTGNAQFFVWRVKNTFREQFINNLYHAALNLRQMVNYMAEPLLEGSKYETKMRNRKNILVLALIRHDESLMLFRDF